jgi:uncharacterized protein YqfA (UPF0365 family)
MIVLGAVGLVVVLLMLYMVPLRLWIAAKAAGASVGMLTLVAMRLRRVPPGGRVEAVVNALISADKAGMNLDFRRAAAIDLAGRNVLEAVAMSVNPKVIETPKVSAVAKDGIQLLAFARVTVRANLDRLVGGAGEATVIARVGQGVVSTIGAAQDYKHVLEHPSTISKNVINAGLDAGTAFEILSIDIADVEVGANVGAKLQTEQAEANKQVAQAAAESRRALAVAQEQEMKARTQEMRAKLVEAEAQIPMSIADAFRSGRLGVMDYYNMRNVMADTEMRQGIAGSVGGKRDGGTES